MPRERVTVRIEEQRAGLLAITIVENSFERVTVMRPASVTMEPVTPGSVVPPTFEFSLEYGRAFLQGLVDAAAAYGVIPTTLTPSNQAQLAALQENLEDLRALLGILRPGKAMTVNGEVARLQGRRAGASGGEDGRAINFELK